MTLYNMVGPMKHLVETNAIIMSSGMILNFPYISVEVRLRWEISGSLVLSSPHHERTLAAAASRRAKESGLFFKFLSDKT